MRALTILILCAPLLAAADIVVPVDKVEDSVNIRQLPDASSAIVGQLRRGDALPHVGSTDGWHEVRIDDETRGFISADWSRVEAGPESVVEVVPEAEPEPESEAEPEPGAVPEPGTRVEAPPEPSPEPDPEPSPEAALVVEAAPEPEAEVEATPEPVVEPAPAPAITLKGDVDYIIKMRRPGELGSSSLFDDGNRVGIATDEPQQRLDVNGSIQVHDRNSNVAGLIITQASGDTGYIMHNRANTLTIGAGSIDRITIDRDGNVGVGVARPSHPLEMASGAYVTAGGVWTNRSSRLGKENISALAPDDALAAVMALEPVRFSYVAEQGEEYVGFVAEDLPELLATSDRASLSPVDVIAALTKVVQEQQRRIDALETQLAER